jgi:Ala-tRNA(Pro) deacylase
MNPADIVMLLRKLTIPFRLFEHEAVFTTTESSKLKVDIPGALTKQLLMKERNGDRVILAIVMHDKKVDMKKFAKLLESKPLEFSSAELMMELLHVTPGSVTPFGLIFDSTHRIEVIVDVDAWNIGQFQFHPLINTVTITLDQEGFEKFLRHTGHDFFLRTIPSKIT